VSYHGLTRSCRSLDLRSAQESRKDSRKGTRKSGKVGVRERQTSPVGIFRGIDRTLLNEISKDSTTVRGGGRKEKRGGRGKKKSRKKGPTTVRNQASFSTAGTTSLFHLGEEWWSVLTFGTNDQAQATDL